MRIIIFGANGFVGRRILQRLVAQGEHEVLAVSRSEDLLPTDGYEFAPLDMTDAAATERLLQAFAPSVVVNAAALSVVDYCEQHPDEALALNVAAPDMLARWCAANDCRLLHLSTDFVFDGRKPTPYVETDAANAVNHYGRTKRMAEVVISAVCQDYAVLRIEVVYGKPLAGQHGNIVELVKQRLSQGQNFTAAADQWRTPTWVEDIASATLSLLDSKYSGVYHVAGGEQMSIAELAVRVADFFGLDATLIQPVNTADMHEATPRPAFTPLDCSKAKSDFGHAPTRLEVALAHEYGSNNG